MKKRGSVSMYNVPYVHPYYLTRPMYVQPMYGQFPQEMYQPYQQYPYLEMNRVLRDHGKQPYVVNIEDATKKNKTFRTAIWTGNHLQVTLMSIGVGADIGLEVHPHVDQFLRIEDGQGIVMMGDSHDHLDFERRVGEDDAIMVPAGKWHNIVNTGRKPLKLYSIYAPPEHPFGTVHRTKRDAMHHHHHQ